MGFSFWHSLSAKIGCKITAANRLPASFFVSVAYDCWAFRRPAVRSMPLRAQSTMVMAPERAVDGIAGGGRPAVVGHEQRTRRQRLPP